MSDLYFKIPIRGTTTVNPKLKCMYPGCNLFAHREIKEGDSGWIALCKPHWRTFDYNFNRDWQPQRREKI